MKSKVTPNLIHSMDAAHCNRIIHGGESHFPKLKTQEEIDAEEKDANASVTLCSWCIQFTINLRNRLRRSWQ